MVIIAPQRRLVRDIANEYKAIGMRLVVRDGKVVAK